MGQVMELRLSCYLVLLSNQVTRQPQFCDLTHMYCIVVASADLYWDTYRIVAILYRFSPNCNKVSFFPNPHNRHPIARPWGRDGEIWVSFVDLKSHLSSASVTAVMHAYHITLDCIITALHCIITTADCMLNNQPLYHENSMASIYPSPALQQRHMHLCNRSILWDKEPLCRTLLQL